MTYTEAIEYLYNVAPAFEKVGANAYKEGLANTIALDSHFAHPHHNYHTIHIAGTNGKGTCSHTIAAILQCQGYRVGLYTSPHLVDFTERIRVNGKPIPRERVVAFIEQEQPFFIPLQPSFFELTTALAFKYFEEQQVDIAVIEVGLGGRLDCTNIINPILSIITNISFDHTQFLGTSLAAIAREKAGIIKNNTPCLIGEDTPETRPIFEQIAREKHAPLHFASDYPAEKIRFQLKGFYQEKNKQTILSAIKILQPMLKIDPTAVAEGCSHMCELTGLMGRWQILNRQPLVVCDTGHNLAAWQYLSKQIAQTAARHSKNTGSALRIVFGMVDDKDISSILRLLPQNAQYYFCQANNHRAIPSSKILQLANTLRLQGKSFPSVRQAYNTAIADADNSDFIFIGGSSYVVAEILSPQKS